jgi:alanine-glyoxylate transaminase / serine-glyoxylate transaminase / serine-pyruvate transaminase
MDAGPWMDDVLLLTPGPTPIHPWAAAALRWPMRGHMDPDVFAYNDAIMADLARLYGAADGAFACLLGGSGSLGMESGLANLLEPGERVLIASNGVFGERMVEMAHRLGAEFDVVRAPAGEPLEPAAVRRAAHARPPKVLAFVHGETSTGVLNPLPELAAAAAEVEALVSVDAVTTVGMGPFGMAEHGIDYAYTGSQKCLSAPPGLAPVAYSARALAAVARRRTPVSTWYADVIGMQGYWLLGAAGRQYHHTVPIHLHWAVGEAIRAALHEGLDARARRAASLGGALLGALEPAGFRAAVAAEHRLPTVLSVLLPEGIDDAAWRSALRSEDGISVAGGLGPTAGLVWRLGLMGEAAHAAPYRQFVAVLERRLRRDDLVRAYDEACRDAGLLASGPPAAPPRSVTPA